MNSEDRIGELEGMVILMEASHERMLRRLDAAEFALERALARPGVATELDRICRGLGTAEVQVLTWVAQRLAKGQAQYGRLDLEHDQRDWTRERSEELGDAVVYSALLELTRIAREGRLVASVEFVKPVSITLTNKHG
jgi:hypothetical protein